jgi:general secretion pathway protein C
VPGTSLQLRFTRYFWAFNLLFILVASYLSARTMNLFVEQKIRPPPTAGSGSGVHGPVASTALPLSPEAFAKLMGIKLPEILASPDGVAAAPAADQPDDLSSEPVRTSLKAQLLATVLANRPEWSLCTLRDLTANESDVYMVGDPFMGATILDIQDLKAIILNGGHREFIDLEVGGGGAPAPIAALGTPKPTTDGIKKIDDKHYQLQRSTVNAALADMNKLATDARIVPSFKNGQANGFKLFSIKPDSLYSQIGVQNGDVIQSINGFDMNSPDKALEAYGKLRSAASLDLTLERGGQTVNMHYGIQ